MNIIAIFNNNQAQTKPQLKPFAFSFNTLNITQARLEVHKQYKYVWGRITSNQKAQNKLKLSCFSQ